MNYAAELRLSKGTETIVFSEKIQRDYAIRLALSELGGYEDFREFDTQLEPTHERAVDWFNS